MSFIKLGLPVIAPEKYVKFEKRFSVRVVESQERLMEIEDTNIMPHPVLKAGLGSCDPKSAQKPTKLDGMGYHILPVR